MLLFSSAYLNVCLNSKLIVNKNTRKQQKINRKIVDQN
jgi:hypothetical protein